MKGKTALVIGATGLVGRALVDQLLTDAEYASVIVFVRRSLGRQHEKLTEHIIDFERPDTWRDKVKGDVLFSTLGTTKKQAGTTAAQRVVDYTYQYSFAQAAAQNGVPTYVLVSSVGADAASIFPYTKMKGELDSDVQRLSFKSVTILRPGPLTGPRENPRGGEKFAVNLLGAFNKIGLLSKYKPISDVEVATAMRLAAHQSQPRNRILEPKALFAYISQVAQA